MDKCKPLVEGGVCHHSRRHQPATQAEHRRAVQIDPIKPTLKAPGTKRLKLNYDEPLSNFAFKFNLRRHNTAMQWSFETAAIFAHIDAFVQRCKDLVEVCEAGAYTPPLFGST